MAKYKLIGHRGLPPGRNDQQEQKLTQRGSVLVVVRFSLGLFPGSAVGFLSDFETIVQPQGTMIYKRVLSARG